MAKIEAKVINNQAEWERFLATRLEANFLQSWYWGEFHKALGNRVFRIGFYNGNELVGITQAVIENARRGRYLTVPAGPIIDWENEDVVNIAFKELTKIAKLERCVFVRVRPQLESNDFSNSIFKKFGFISAPMHLHAELTSQLEISKSEEQLMSDMRKATRYEIKKAISQGIKVTSTDDPKSIREFYNIEIDTSKRQGFVPFSYNYLYKQFEVFSKAGKVLLYSAKYDDKLLAEAIVIFYGHEADYHYGASTQLGRQYPGAYLIQWEAIKEAKRRGLDRYNLWGVAPENQKKHRFYGLSIFKRGFGGHDFEYLHARDLVINYPRYLVNFLIEEVRKRIRHV